MSPKSLARLFAKINSHDGNPDVCWEWIGAVGGRDRRPIIWIKGKLCYAARVVCELKNGPPPCPVEDPSPHVRKSLERRYVARHTCDNKMCCNPEHLIWGTHQENMDDMKERERHGLSHYVVRNIKRLIEAGRSQEEISKLYGVARETISAIATGRVYGHVGVDDSGNASRMSRPQNQEEGITSHENPSRDGFGEGG